MSEYRKKLIEVALPLDEINSACKADKDRTSGTIKSLHKWFAPMPLPAWRALLYAALVDDPDDDEKRAYHLDLIKRLVANGAELPDEETLREARENILRQFPDGVPPVLDPFCGGGSTLVEAQRLGLRTVGSDLNPVPVLITRTLTEMVPAFFGQQPLHPEVSLGGRQGRSVPDAQEALPNTGSSARHYHGYEGLVRDVEHYAEMVRLAAWSRIGEHYPSASGETITAWLWARTAVCPNPACGIETVLTTTWWLSKKKGDLAWINPRVEDGRVHLEVISGRETGSAPEPPKGGRGAKFACLGCGGAITEATLDSQARLGQLGLRMTAIVAERDGIRQFRMPESTDIEAASVDLVGVAVPDNVPVGDGGSRKRFGLTSQADLYTPRQLLALGTFADLVASVGEQVRADGGSAEYARTVVTILGLAVGRLAMRSSSLARATVQNDGSSTRYIAAFGRNDLPMSWDFPEVNPAGEGGAWQVSIPNMLDAFRFASNGVGIAERRDARHAGFPEGSGGGLVATDPPYFDAIGYADLSDYFYVWHRRALKDVHPDLYATVAAPKLGELTAVPSHHGNDRAAARDYFIRGFTETFENLKASLGEGLPLLVVYASKEQKGGVGEESRWSSILTAIVDAGIEITGTWPVYGTNAVRLVGNEANAVATYVVMVCRPRPSTAGSCSLADFNRALRRELKTGVHNLQAAGILPVDLAQAAMGPGMQIYSRYREVLDQTGQPVPVNQALRLINSALSEVLDEQEGELDPDSRFAVAWWERHGWSEALFGEADQLARPQGISVDDVVRAGVAEYSRPGFVRVVGNADLNRTWQPSLDSRPTAWEAVHHLADRLIDGGGMVEAGALMGHLGVLRDQAQGLVYRLHAIAARKGWTKDQERYNSLIGSWSDLLAESGRSHGEMDGLF